MLDQIGVGDGASLTGTLTAEEAAAFAAVSRDLKLLRLDAAALQLACDAPAPIVQGAFCTALCSALLGVKTPRPATVVQSQSLRFHRPALAGDAITVSVTVARNVGDGRIFFSCKAVNQRAEIIVDGKVEVIVSTQIPAVEDTQTIEVEGRHKRHALRGIIETARDAPPIKTAVCHPCDETSLGSALDAARSDIIVPTLVGPERKIRAVGERFGYDLGGVQIRDAKHSHDAARLAVALCRSGQCEALMKGSLHTDEIMSEVMNSATGLRTGRRLSHVYIADAPAYSKPLYVTDAAINIYPSLQEKADIVQNAINFAQIMGVDQPWVAILSAVETVTPKIPSTIEASALCKMAERGQIKGGIVDGPLAFDNAISLQAARIKGIDSQVAGRADILVVPDLEAGNMLAKQLCYLDDADMAGIVLGARVPIILTSRADSAQARLASCAVAARCARAHVTGRAEAT